MLNLPLKRKAIDWAAIVTELPRYILNTRIQPWCEFISSFFQGILLLDPAAGASASKITRLWIHEVYRVFYDRLVDQADRETFFDIVKVIIFFKFTLHKPVFNTRLLQQPVCDGSSVTKSFVHYRRMFWPQSSKRR